MGGTSQSSTLTPTTTDTTTHTEAVGNQGASFGGGSGANAIDLSSASGSTVTLTQESPQALAFAAGAVQGALQLAESTTASSLGYSASLAAKNSGTPLSQLGDLVKPIGYVLLALVAVYFILRKKS